MTVRIRSLSVTRTETLRSGLLSRTALSGVVALSIVGIAPEVKAAPKTPTVVSGGVTFTNKGANELDITQTTAKAIINWQSFSIGAGETVKFFQPNASAIALNRVTGGSSSQILGYLGANGQIWIVNPAGVFFGPNARVNVGGLIATTHDIKNSDFIAGRYVFQSDTQPSGIIENRGSITAADAGLVAFVAPGVVNHGIITARLGEVTLASGNAFTVDFYGDQKINLVLSNEVAQQVLGSDGKPLTSLVHNDGKIFADGGLVQLTAAAAKGVVDTVINNGGVIQARSVEQKNGKIILAGDDAGAVVNSGTLDASGKGAGQTGGTVLALGESVALTSTSKIDVSGAAGGGDVLIGGEFRGGNATAADYAEYATHPTHKPAVPNSALTVVDAGATIDADAITNGAGGKVVVWADEVTSYHGSISARGGAQGGNGGFVEVSGHQLDFNGTVNRKAAVGRDGTLLLDPYNITITSGGNTSSFSTGTARLCYTISGSTTCGTGSGYVAATSDSVIATETVESLLNNGNLAISTSSNGSQGGNIYITSNLSWSASSGLLLSAAGNIDLIGAIISNQGTGSLILNPGNTGGAGSVVFSGNGNLISSSSTGYFAIVSGAMPTRTSAIYGGYPFSYSPDGGVLYTNNSSTPPNGVTVYSNGTVTFSGLSLTGSSSNTSNNDSGSSTGTTTTAVATTTEYTKTLTFAEILAARNTAPAGTTTNNTPSALPDIPGLSLNGNGSVTNFGMAGTTPATSGSTPGGAGSSNPANNGAGAVMGAGVGANIAAGSGNISANMSVSDIINALVPGNSSAISHGGYLSPVGTDISLGEECVSLVKALGPAANKATGIWNQGVEISATNGSYPAIVPGTPIATFMQNGKYPPPNANIMDTDPNPNGSGRREPHAAIFLGYITNSQGSVIGMSILDQSDGHPAKVDQRMFVAGAGGQVENYTYSVIQ